MNSIVEANFIPDRIKSAREKAFPVSEHTSYSPRFLKECLSESLNNDLSEDAIGKEAYDALKLLLPMESYLNNQGVLVIEGVMSCWVPPEGRVTFGEMWEKVVAFNTCAKGSFGNDYKAIFCASKRDFICIAEDNLYRLSNGKEKTKVKLHCFIDSCIIDDNRYNLREEIRKKYGGL